MGQRRRARECALQMLYQIDQTGIEPQDLFGQFWSSHPVDSEVQGFAELLVAGVAERCSEIDAMITESAANWRIERMAVVDRNVLRIALYELLTEPGTPHAVVIDEAIEVGKKYGSLNSGKFINGILDSIRQRLARQPSEAGDDLAE